MPLLLANWKLILIALLVATAALFEQLWYDKVQELAEFKGKIEQAGETAKKEKDRVEKLHSDTVAEINNSWFKAVPTIRADALANFKQRYPSGLCAPAGGVPVSANADSPASADGTGSKQVVAGAPSDDFVSACALDAAKVGKWQEWATLNQLKVE